MSKPLASGRPSPTLIDVARLAGVSTSTASRVLRGSSYPVDQSLREKVLVAAGEIGYVPNLQARNLRQGAVGFIGLIVGSISDPFFGEVAQAVTARSHAFGKMAIVANMQRDPRIEIELCRHLWEHRVAGLILSGGSFDQFQRHEELCSLLGSIVETGTKVVSLAHRNLPVPTIAVDNETVGRRMAEYVLGFGHRRIGVVFGPPVNLLNKQRLSGLIQVFRAAGAEVSVEHAQPQAEAGATATRALLARDPSLTAIVAGGDMQAVGIFRELRAMGHRIPEDISVTGMGNSPYADLLHPRLATMDVGIARCGAAAIDLICSDSSQMREHKTVAVEPKLVAGGSLAATRHR